MERRHFEYWLSQSDPVLILRYYDEGSTFYWCWAHDVAPLLRPTANSLSVANYLRPWDRDISPNEIQNFLAKKVQVLSSKLKPPFIISVTSTELPPIDLLAFTERLRNLVELHQFEVVANDRADATFKISIERTTIAVSHLGLPGFVLSREELPSDFHSFIWLLIFLTACRYERSLVSRLLAQTHTSLLLHDLPAVLLAPVVDAFCYLFGIKEAAQKLEFLKVVNSKDKNEWQLMLFIALFTAAHQYKQIDEWTALLDHAISAEDNPIQKATLSYNKGNALAAKNAWKEAIDAFKLASAYDTNYLDRHHYHRELAAALFENENYADAAIHYQRALDIKDDPHTLCLLGDALFCAGDFASAYDMLCNAMDKDIPSHVIAHAFLQKFLCEEMLKCWNIDKLDTPYRYEKEGETLAFLAKLTEAEFNSHMQKLLEKYACDAYFNFNAGNACSLAEKNSIAAYRFFHCGFHQRGDARAWALGIANAKLANDDNLALLGIIVGYFFCGERVISEYLQCCHPTEINEPDLLEWQQEIVDLFRSAHVDIPHSATIRFTN